MTRVQWWIYCKFLTPSAFLEIQITVGQKWRPLLHPTTDTQLCLIFYKNLTSNNLSAFHVLHNPTSAIACIFFIITANKGTNHWFALSNQRQQKQAENICHRMSRIYLMFTDLRALFLTVRSKFLPSFLVHSTPCVSTPEQVSLFNISCLLQIISFQLSPSHPQIFLPIPA